MKYTTLWKCDICGTEYRDKRNVSSAKLDTRKKERLLK